MEDTMTHQQTVAAITLQGQIVPPKLLSRMQLDLLLGNRRTAYVSVYLTSLQFVLEEKYAGKFCLLLTATIEKGGVIKGREKEIITLELNANRKALTRCLEVLSVE